MSIWDLLEAFDLVCKAIGTVGDIRQIMDDTPIDLYQIEILHRLQTEGPMTFERIFESRTNRVVMIGLFLAMLELIREKLIWAEQSGGSTIYVRPLTDEPAEQAVQKAILATEADFDESPAAEHEKQPPVPIAELPAQDKRTVSINTGQSQEQPAIPIAELPPESKPVIPPQEQVEPLAESPEEPEHQAAD